MRSSNLADQIYREHGRNSGIKRAAISAFRSPALYGAVGACGQTVVLGLKAKPVRALSASSRERQDRAFAVVHKSQGCFLLDVLQHSQTKNNEDR